ncbi:MAG: NAD(P)/FAD-dependent oxidoreductase [Pararhodobacter sp.]|nr:NAD(P)/FAD-dependent oxidoreductase [Pararhodobacter sp.]
MKRATVAIVGGGQAGAALAARLRAGGFDGTITMFAEESRLPYQRPPLSKKYPSGDWEAERLLLHPAAFWREAGIDVCVASKVLAIDPAQKSLETEQGRIFSDQLVLTTGARPRPRPQGFGGRNNVFDLRTIRDVDALRPYFRTGLHMLVLGGGYIGLETAAVAASAGFSVTVVERAPRLLARVACAQTAAEIRALHEKQGVRIMEGRAVTRTEGETALTAVHLDNGARIPLDLAVVGIGVLPRSELAERAGVVCSNGIRVDFLGRTSSSGIWAAGDCANFDFDGQPTRLESVQNAIDQAESVADAILGAPRAYRPVPWFWSDQFDTKLQIAGLSRGFDHVIARSSSRGKSFWYFRRNQLIAVDALNDARAFMEEKNSLKGGRWFIPLTSKLQVSTLSTCLRLDASQAPGWPGSHRETARPCALPVRHAKPAHPSDTMCRSS